MSQSMFSRCAIWSVALLCLFVTPQLSAKTFKVGFGKQNITPARPMPMWGYGARHDALSTGVNDPLYAKAVVIEAGNDRLAIIGLDLGRSPAGDSMERIRKAILDEFKIEWVMLCGSHTHHGPVIELRDREGEGKGRFDDAVTYAADLEAKIVQAIGTAVGNLQDAKIGWGSQNVPMNRNRHSKIEPKPVDPELGVIRLDNLEGKPIALLVNYAAHPTMLKTEDLRYSADWPGQMMKATETTLQTNCVFLQGASGDLSPQTTEETRSIETFGAKLSESVIAVHNSITTTIPQRPSIRAKRRTFEFSSRLPLREPLTQMVFRQAFFPELVTATLAAEAKDDKVRPEMTTLLINRQLALVGASGEFFCQHANSLKQRSRAEETFFIGYCNGHHMYFPTIEGAAEGGYGADPTVSWVELGAGETMINQALIDLFTIQGSFLPAFP
jgi:neutral ceramidase